MYNHFPILKEFCPLADIMILDTPSFYAIFGGCVPCILFIWSFKLFLWYMIVWKVLLITIFIFVAFFFFSIIAHPNIISSYNISATSSICYLFSIRISLSCNSDGCHSLLKFHHSFLLHFPANLPFKFLPKNLNVYN